MRSELVEDKHNMTCKILFQVQPVTMPEKTTVHHATFDHEPTVRDVLQHFEKLLAGIKSYEVRVGAEVVPLDRRLRQYNSVIVVCHQ
jgi:hypothetical protein